MDIRICPKCAGDMAVTHTIPIAFCVMRRRRCKTEGCNNRYVTFEVREELFERLLRLLGTTLEVMRAQSRDPQAQMKAMANVPVTSKVTAEQEEVDALMARLLPKSE